MDKLLREYLEDKDIHYVAHRHERVFSVAESNKSRKIREIPGMHCKTLFLRDNLGSFYLIGMPAHKRLDIKKLESHLGVRKLKFGSPKELEENVSLAPGSVSVFGMVNVEHKEKNRGKSRSKNNKRRVKLILDKEVWEAETVGFHPNENTATLEIKHRYLKKFYGSLESERDCRDLIFPRTAFL